MMNKSLTIKSFLLLFLVAILGCCLLALCACHLDDDTPQQPSEPIDHTHSYLQTVTIQPTCTETGIRSYVCNCGNSYTEQIAAMGHQLEVVVRDDGHLEACKKCDYATQKVAHNYDETVITVATCTQAGEVRKVCRVCGETVNEYVAQLNHEWTLWGNDESQHWSICANCNTVQTSKSDHDFREIDKASATCYEDGYVLIECNACGYNKRDVIAAHHNYYSTDEGRVDPTCTDFGTHVEICSACDNRRTVVDTSLGYADHTLAYYEPQAVTADDDGNVDYWQCNVCGKYFSSYDCERELNEDEIFIRATKTYDVQTVAELEEIARRDYVGEASKEWYKINLYVLEVIPNSYMCLFDDNDDMIEIYFDGDIFNLSGINFGDEVTIKGHLIVLGGEVTLLDAELHFVYCDDPELFNLFFTLNGDLEQVQLYTVSDSGCDLQVVNYGTVRSLYNFNCLMVGETLTLYYYSYSGVVIKSLVINGESYTMTNSVLSVVVTEDVYVEIVFGYDDENNVTVNSFVAPTTVEFEKYQLIAVVYKEKRNLIKKDLE